MAFRWRVSAGPLILVFGSSLPLINLKKKKRQSCGPPLIKLSGSAHAYMYTGPLICIGVQEICTQRHVRISGFVIVDFMC